MEQNLKGSIYLDTKKICREAGIFLNVEYDSTALDVIAELVWKKLQMFGEDLEAFQKHAKRLTITPDDVKLLIRKNDSLKDLVSEVSRGHEKDKTEGKSGKRKRKAT